MNKLSFSVVFFCGAARALRVNPGNVISSGGAGGAGSRSGAGAGGLAGQLSSLINEIQNAAGGSSGGASASAGGAPLSSSMMSDASGIMGDLEEMAITHDQAHNGSSGMRDSIRSAMKSGSPTTLTMAEAEAAFGGMSHGSSFLKSVLDIIPQAKISSAELQQIAADVENAINAGFSGGNVNYDACPSGFENGGGNVCSPTSYSGFCNRSFTNVGTVAEKQEYEAVCNVRYPSA